MASLYPQRLTAALKSSLGFSGAVDEDMVEGKRKARETEAGEVQSKTQAKNTEVWRHCQKVMQIADFAILPGIKVHK